MEKRTRHVAVIICLMLATFLLTHTHFLANQPRELSESVQGGANFDRVPRAIEGWVARDVQVDEKAFTILKRDADAWMVREYRRDGDVVLLSMVMATDQRKLFRVHIPDICLPAQGWSVMDRNLQEIPLGPSRSLVATRLMTKKGNLTSQVLYWFTSNTRVVESKIIHRLLLVWDGVMGERTPGTLIQVMSPVRGSNRENVQQLQADFIEMMFPYFPEMRGLRQSA